jgi:bacillithiol system protein YtxJ
MVLNRFERAYKEPAIEKPAMYLLDLIRYRALSNALAERLKVEHESPQVMVLYQGHVVHHASHTGIDWSEVNGFIFPLNLSV